MLENLLSRSNVTPWQTIIHFLVWGGQNKTMKITLFLFSTLVFLQPLVAGGPWLVYQHGTRTLGGFVLINLGYDNGPQFTGSELDDGENGSIRYLYNQSTRKTEVWILTWDGDDADGSSLKNQWHRTSWGREGKTFILLHSQYEVVGASGVADHGVGFGTGSCVTWPNRGKSIGVSGDFPTTINFQMRRLDGNWNGAALGAGRRNINLNTSKFTLDIPLTKALNDARAGLATNLQAKNWVIDYLVSTRNFQRVSDEIRP